MAGLGAGGAPPEAAAGALEPALLQTGADAVVEARGARQTHVVHHTRRVLSW